METERGKMEKEWREMEGRINEALREIEEGNKKGGRNEECKRKKMEIRRELTEWWKRGKDGEKYKERKRNYVRGRRKLRNEKGKTMKARRKNEVWEIINRNRERRKVNEGIGMET